MGGNTSSSIHNTAWNAISRDNLHDSVAWFLHLKLLCFYCQPCLDPRFKYRGGRGGRVQGSWKPFKVSWTNSSIFRKKGVECHYSRSITNDYQFIFSAEWKNLSKNFKHSPWKFGTFKNFVHNQNNALAKKGHFSRNLFCKCFQKWLNC